MSGTTSSRLKSAPVAINRYGVMVCMVCGTQERLTAYRHAKDLPAFDRQLRRFRSAHLHLDGDDHGRAA